MTYRVATGVMMVDVGFDLEMAGILKNLNVHSATVREGLDVVGIGSP